MRDWRHSWARQAQRMGNLLLARRGINRPYHQRARMGQREWSWLLDCQKFLGNLLGVLWFLQIEHARRNTRRQHWLLLGCAQLWPKLLSLFDLSSIQNQTILKKQLKKIIFKLINLIILKTLSTMNIVFFVLLLTPALSQLQLALHGNPSNSAGNFTMDN